MRELDDQRADVPDAKESAAPARRDSAEARDDGWIDGELEPAAAETQRARELSATDLPPEVRSRIPEGDLRAMAGPVEYHTVAQEDLALAAFNTAAADSTKLRWWTTQEAAESIATMDGVRAVDDALRASDAQGAHLDPALREQARELLDHRAGEGESPDLNERLGLPPEFSIDKDGKFSPRDTLYTREVKQGEPLEYIKSQVAPQPSDTDGRTSPETRFPGGEVQYYVLSRFAQPVEGKRLGATYDLGPGGDVRYAVPAERRPDD